MKGGKDMSKKKGKKKKPTRDETFEKIAKYAMIGAWSLELSSLRTYQTTRANSSNTCQTQVSFKEGSREAPLFDISNYTMTHKQKMHRYLAWSVVAILLGLLIKMIGSAF